MKSRVSTALLLACVLTAGCDLPDILTGKKDKNPEATPTSPTSPSGSTSMDAFAGTWSSATASTPASGCGNLKYTVTPTTSTSAAVTFTATCASNITVNGSGAGTLSGNVVDCDCTRAQIEARTAASVHQSSELVYDGFCRDRGLPLAEGVGWRVRMDPGAESFDDQRLGMQQQDPSLTGDVLVRDRLGNWTYQFCVSVDDYRQGIDLVIRGEDLLPSTGRQIRIARLLGRERQATFFHHPLLMKSPTQKLSKSDGDTGIRELRARGWTPEQVKAAARSDG